MFPTRARPRLDASYGFDVCRLIDPELLRGFRSSSICAGGVCSISECAPAQMACVAGFGMRHGSTRLFLATACAEQEILRRAAFCDAKSQRNSAHLWFDLWYIPILGSGDRRCDFLLYSCHHCISKRK